MSSLPRSLTVSHPRDPQPQEVTLERTRIRTSQLEIGLPIDLEPGYADGDFWVRVRDTQGSVRLVLRTSTGPMPVRPDLKLEAAPPEAYLTSLSGEELLAALNVFSKGNSRLMLRAHVTQPALPVRSAPETGLTLDCDPRGAIDKLYRAQFYPLLPRKPGRRPTEGARCHHVGIARERDSFIGDMSALLEAGRAADRKEINFALAWLRASGATWVTIDFVAPPP